MRLKEWFGGPIIHVHTRLENKSVDCQPREEIQFTLAGLLEYARRFSGDKSITVVDTDHAALSIHPDWASDTKQDYFFPQNSEATGGREVLLGKYRRAISQSVLVSQTR